MTCSCPGCSNVATPDEYSAADLCDACFEAESTGRACDHDESESVVRAITLALAPRFRIVSLAPDSEGASR